MAKHILDQVSLPSNSCLVKNCETCVRSRQTYILHDLNLYNPQNFILRKENASTSNTPKSFSCAYVNGTACHCNKNTCDGDSYFCQSAKCIENSPCWCYNEYTATQLIHVDDERTIKNPNMLTIDICLWEKTVPSKAPQRRLLEHESAVFSNKQLNFTFKDPILTFSDSGRIILRSEDFEHLYTIPQDLSFVIPYELLSYKNDITITYLHNNGHILTGTIHVSGKKMCQRTMCYFCASLFTHLQCFPKTILYPVYILASIFIILFIWCLKTILKSIIYIFQVLFYVFYVLFRIFKLCARCSLLLGAYVGSTIQSITFSFYEFLEQHRAQGVQLPIQNIVILLLCLGSQPASADCNTQAIIQSDLRSCEPLSDGTTSCNMFTTAEISLQSIHSESCIYFTDKKEQHLFTLKLKLDAVTCSFLTKRKYFTFPVTAKHISQVSCIYNAYCGRGVHCHKDIIGRTGLNFEAESEESKSYPGKSSCVSGGIGVGCAILTRASCNFFRTWYVPDLLHSYEVSTITGHTCQYHVSVSHIENNTVSRVTVSDSVYTETGIKIIVLGAFDQPQIHIKESFIQRVGRPMESYLATTSERNVPRAGEIGCVQANHSYTKDFIFDPALSTCDFFEDRLRCSTPRDPLTQLQQSQEFALPMERDMHLFQIKNGKLISSLLMSSAIRLQLHFQNYKITAQTNTVCPKFSDAPFEITGCYQCQLMARLKFSAQSTCQKGMVLIQFQSINIHTKALNLQTDIDSFVIKFLGEQKCYEEKLCLKAQTLIQCQKIEFCLEEPSVELVNLNTNYTVHTGSSTSNSWPDWANLANLGPSLYILKYIGSILFIICVIISISTALVTCFCRSK